MGALQNRPFFILALVALLIPNLFRNNVASAESMEVHHEAIAREVDETISRVLMKSLPAVKAGGIGAQRMIHRRLMNKLRLLRSSSNGTRDSGEAHGGMMAVERRRLGQQLANGRWIRALDHGSRTPPLGWNSWNHFSFRVNEAIVRSAADMLVETGLAKVGFVYVNIDDCWSAMKRNKGRLVPDRAKFPSGIKKLADYVHSKGLKLGIYADAGTMTCGKRPGSLGYETVDAQTFADWGVDYLKYDNCYDAGVPIKKRYKAMKEALEATGRDIFYNMCEWGKSKPATWAHGVADSWRTTEDITDDWTAMMKIAYANNQWASYAKPGGWNDADMLEVGNGGMLPSEYRTHMSLWAIMKAPMLIGCNMRNMTKSTRGILTNTEVIAVNQDTLGIQGELRPKGKKALIDVWSGPLSGKRYALAIVNLGRRTMVGKATWKQIGVSSSKRFIVRDLWKKFTYDQPFERGINVTLAPHDVGMFLLTPA